MNKLFSVSVLIIVFTLGVNAQFNVTKPTQEKIITKVSDEFYSVEVKDEKGFTVQQGMYLAEGNKLIPHGIWTLYAHQSDEVLTKIKYDKGEKIWIETLLDGEKVRVDQNQLTILRLESRIASLEKKLADAQNK